VKLSEVAEIHLKQAQQSTDSINEEKQARA
jgi:hypothetical protein